MREQRAMSTARDVIAKAIADFGGEECDFPNYVVNRLIEAPDSVRQELAGRPMLERIKNRVDYRLNDWLCKMKPDYDDSITGFNEAWDIVRTIFKEELEKLPLPAPPKEDKAT